MKVSRSRLRPAVVLAGVAFLVFFYSFGGAQGFRYNVKYSGFVMWHQ